MSLSIKPTAVSFAGALTQDYNTSSSFWSVYTMCFWLSAAPAEPYFRDVCAPVAGISGRAHLRSAERCDMLVPRTRTRFGQRNFRVAAPVVWNSLPTHLRSTSVSREQFRDGLKTHLFTQTYAFLRTFCLRAYTTLTLTLTLRQKQLHRFIFAIALSELPLLWHYYEIDDFDIIVFQIYQCICLPTIIQVKKDLTKLLQK